MRLQIDDEPPVVLSESQYNSLGQLIRKRLHSTDDAATFAQALEYRYHIRGWLTSINQGALEPPGDPTSLFALRLSYEDTLDSPQSVPQFNGNVSRVRWKTTAADAVQTYLYRYDGLDRLVAAHYRVGGASDRGFDESGIAYDPNGNISRLSRYSIVSGQRTLIDGLKYRYRGNQARSIRDTTGRAEGFRDGSGDSDDYEYDFNGNMVVDRNRGVRIRYNALNLVDEVSKTSGGSVRFGFDADGVKRFRELLAADSNVAERLDYVGNCVLQDGGLRLVMHDEGRLVRASDGERWRFQYFLTDHLGNVRVAFEPSPGGPGSPTTPPVVYAADYYPYGLRIDHGSGDDAGGAPVQHLLAGKELEDVLGLEWYDFGARMLDPATGRWLVQDPAAEEHPSVSPYAYVSNNPLRYVDPDGRDWWEFSLFGQKVTLNPRDWAGPRAQLRGLYKGANVAAAGVIGGAGTGAAAGCAAGAAVGAAGAGVGAAPGCGVCSASECLSGVPGFFTPCRLTCKDSREGSRAGEEEHAQRRECHVQRQAQAAAVGRGEVPDLAAVVDRRADAAPGGRALECGPDDDHADPSCRARGRAWGVGAVQAGAARGRRGCGARRGARGDQATGGDGQGAGDRVGRVAGKNALGLVGAVPARVEARVKQALLDLLDGMAAGGWTFARACRLLGVQERRARRWQQRRLAGELGDRPGGGNAVHGLMPEEVAEILAVAERWGEIDGSHRKLAHRGSYERRVWVSPSTVLRVLLEHGRALPYRPPRARSVKRPWPDWVDYRPRQVWGYDITEFPSAGTQALAILDLVSRKWIDTLICPQASDLQVKLIFTRALEAEGLMQQVLETADQPAEQRRPVLLAVSDNGPQMTSGSTREFMALHAIATHYGRPGTPTDQAHIESLFGHVKYDWPHLCHIADVGDLARELDAVRAQYNGVRLHAGIGYVTPDDEHEGRGARIRAARRHGLQRARAARIAYHRSLRLAL